MESRIVFLVLAILLLYVILNPASRSFIKDKTAGLFGSAE
jgi:hypothetical protein